MSIYISCFLSATVWINVCGSVLLDAVLSVHYLIVFCLLFVYLSCCLSLCLPILYLCKNVCISVSLSFYMAVFLSVWMRVFIHSYVLLSAAVSALTSIFLSVYLTVSLWGQSVWCLPHGLTMYFCLLFLIIWIFSIFTRRFMPNIKIMLFTLHPFLAQIKCYGQYNISRAYFGPKIRHSYFFSHLLYWYYVYM
jgi:hypothetical protein